MIYNIRGYVVLQMGALCFRALALMDLSSPSPGSSLFDAYLSEFPKDSDAYAGSDKGGKLTELSIMIMHLRTVCSNLSQYGMEQAMDFLPVCLALDLQCTESRSGGGKPQERNSRVHEGGVHKRWNSYDVCKDGCNSEQESKQLGCLMECATRVHD